uniref:Zinc finger, CCHC-type n=1 Tax=Tanacetum cinerariifolium TaxID=118510 RepID=A0A6L2JI62_TANCI|nr:zinc finger, CCHC-type [Tanacetum cinerariifolium]
MKQDGNKKDQSYRYGILQDVEQYKDLVKVKIRMNIKDLVKIRSKQSELKRSKQDLDQASHQYTIFKLHARLGYVHFKRMQDMSKDGLITAIDMDTEKCKTCMLNKITKKSIQNVKRETKVLELIHSDLCDLHATTSLGNKKYFVTFIDDASRFYVIKPNDSVAINSIIESRDAIFDEHRFSSIPRPSQRSLVKGTKDSGGSVVSKRVTNKIVQQSKPQLKKSKRHKTPKDFRPEFQLCLIEGTRDEVFDQHSYCFNVEDYPKTFDETIKSHDVAFWKEAISDEMDSIMGNNTWVLTDLPPGADLWGFKQKSRIDYFDTYVPVARISIIRLLIAMASIHNLIIHQMDVKTTFLNGELPDITFDVRKLNWYPSVLKGYTDASWINNTKDNSSISGWLFLLGGGAISWASKKQTCITGLTMESKFVALAAAGKEVEWLKNLLLEISLWVKPMAPISICCDSAATLAKAYSQMYNGKSRHLGVRHNMIRELITNEGHVHIGIWGWRLVVSDEVQQVHSLNGEVPFTLDYKSELNAALILEVDNFTN